MKNNPWNGTSFHDDVINLSYNELVERIGEPTYDGSGDDKVQKEWQLLTDNNVAFTIYDWKEYERDVTDGEIVEWHIGYKNETMALTSIKTWLNKHGIIVDKSKHYSVWNQITSKL